MSDYKEVMIDPGGSVDLYYSVVNGRNVQVICGKDGNIINCQVNGTTLSRPEDYTFNKERGLIMFNTWKAPKLIKRTGFKRFFFGKWKVVEDTFKATVKL